MMDAKAALYSVATSTFESLAFLVAYGEPAEQAQAPALEARVDFDGLLRGSIAVRASSDVLATVATNMLGLRDAPDATLESDALGEVANVICGNLLPLLAGREALFHLQAPRVSTPRERAVEPAARAVLWLCGGVAEVDLFVEPSAS